MAIVPYFRRCSKPKIVPCDTLLRIIACMSEIARLLLYPVDMKMSPDVNKLLKLLEDIKFVGVPFGVGPEDRYLAGQHFFQFLTFLGCSPAIELEPAAGEVADPGRVCHFLPLEHAQPVARYGLDTLIPRCPSCRQRLEQARDWLADWEPGAGYSCPSCGEVISLENLGWKRSAAFARFFLEVWNIYPGEAVPVDSLLQKLAAHTGCDWSYAYIRNGL